MAVQVQSSSRRVGSFRDAGKEFVVGFDDETGKLVEQLIGGKKQLQIISIVGMPGLGKTTLAKRLLNDPSIVYRFYVRAWTSVTQLPQKKDLLLDIIKSGFDVKDINDNTSDMELSVMLKRRLSGQRYLIVLDGIWDIGAWNDLKLCFPDDNVGSRVIFTSRLAYVPLQAQPGSYQQCLPLLTEEKSWDLLRYKVFQKESCPSSLVEIGLHIARKCRGLPLAIVVIAGILANETSSNWWSQVAQDLSSITVNAPQQYMETLLPSYNHLPNHLKPCFLYFGAFPEDYEIPYRKLTLLWMAEGFIKIQSGEDNLEDVAAGYLKDLVDRSLVMVAKRKYDGGIKVCLVHDLLRDLCIKKAEDENFMHQLKRFSELRLRGQKSASTKSYYDVEAPCLEVSKFGDCPYLLENLQSISGLTQSKHSKEILKRTLNLLKLDFKGNLYPSSTKLTVPNLGILKRLENLSLENGIDSGMCSLDKGFRRLLTPDMFPVTLKKLTLTRTILSWNEMQKIGMLPNLEVLKLRLHGCYGEQWETNDGGFRRLKHLSFVLIDLVDWSASTEHFPNLQHLKLSACKRLEEIPLGIGDIYTLELIEVRNCNPTVAHSAHKIKEDQENKGNVMLKISIIE